MALESESRGVGSVRSAYYEDRPMNTANPLYLERARRRASSQGTCPGEPLRRGAKAPLPPRPTLGARNRG